MRILLACAGMYPEPSGVPLPTAHGGLGAAEVARALRRGWQNKRGDDELVVSLMSEGASQAAECIPPELILHRQRVSAPDPLGMSCDIDCLCIDTLSQPDERGHGPTFSGPAEHQGARTWLLDSAQLLSIPEEGDLAMQHALSGTSAGVGLALRQALDIVGRHDTLIVTLGRSAVHDGGAGFLQALGGIEEAQRLCGDRNVILALGDTVSLGGLGGAGAHLASLSGISPEQAQERDRQACAAASEIIAGSTQAGRGNLLGQRPRLSVTFWGGGAGGGVSLALQALGARALPGARVIAQLTGLSRQIDRCDLVVTSAGEIYDILQDSILDVVGREAASRAIPAVVVAGQALLPRGEQAAAGIVGSYCLADLMTDAGTSWNDGGARAIEERLAEMGARLARTWSRPASL